MDLPPPQPASGYVPSKDGGQTQTGVYWLQRLVSAVANLQQTWRKSNNMKVLAEGQISNAKITLYTVPTNKKAVVRFLSLGNITAGTVVASIIYKRATDRQIYSGSIAANQSVIAISGASEFCLESGDKIEGVTDTATSLDYVITGVEEG